MYMHFIHTAYTLRATREKKNHSISSSKLYTILFGSINQSHSSVPSISIKGKSTSFHGKHINHRQYTYRERREKLTIYAVSGNKIDVIRQFWSVTDARGSVYIIYIYRCARKCIARCSTNGEARVAVRVCARARIENTLDIYNRGERYIINSKARSKFIMWGGNVFKYSVCAILIHSELF